MSRLINKYRLIYILVFGFLCFSWNSGAFAQQSLESLRHQLTVESNDSLRVVIMIKLSREMHRQIQNGEDDIRMATRAMEASAAQDTVLYARSLDNLGLLYRFYQQYKEAIALHVKAYNIIANRNGNSVDKMRYANNAAVAYRNNTDYDMAVEYHMKALRLAERENNTYNIEIACNGIGSTFMAIPGKEKEGLPYLEKALETAKGVGNKRGMAIQNLTIGGYYDQLGQHRKARSYFQDILDITDKNLKDARGRGMGLKALGESYLKEGVNLRQAERYFDEALTVFRKINDQQQQAYTLLALSKLDAEQQRYKQSLPKLKQVMLIAGELNDQKLLQATAETISKHYEVLNDYPLALSYFKIAQNYQDSINLTNQFVQVSAIAGRYNVEKKESEIKLLKTGQSVQKLKLEQRTNKVKARGTIIILLVALFLVLVVGFWLQNKNRKARVKAERLLTKTENQRIKAVYEKNLMGAEILASQMQVNPHFLFNCFNSIKSIIQRNNNELAIKYLAKLARFVRIVLETANKPIHSLKEELALIGNYVDLEKKRFDDSFYYTIVNPLDTELGDIFLPSLLLLPFVENAIWHGLLPSNKTANILSIIIEKTDNSVRICIDDTGVGRTYASTRPKLHKSRGTEINDKRIELFNKSASGNIEYDFIDKTDKNGSSLGTSVLIHIKTNE